MGTERVLICSQLAICPSGEVLLGDLYRSGFEVVKEHEDADAIIVNTCGFVEDAKAESLEVGEGEEGRWEGGRWAE